MREEGNDRASDAKSVVVSNGSRGAFRRATDRFCRACRAAARIRRIGFEIIAAEGIRSGRREARRRILRRTARKDAAYKHASVRCVMHDAQDASAQLPTRSTAQHLNLHGSIGHICSYTTPSRDDRGFTCIFGGLVSTHRLARRPQSYPTARFGESPRYSDGRTVAGRCRAVPRFLVARGATARRHRRTVSSILMTAPTVIIF